MMKNFIFSFLILLLLCLTGCIQSPYETHFYTASKIQTQEKSLKIGDVIIKKEGKSLSSWFGHAALYLGDDTLLEAPNPNTGVIYNRFSSWSSHYDILVLRFKTLSKNEQQRLLEFASTHVFKPYKITLNKQDTHAYDCASLIYAAYSYALNRPLKLKKDNVIFVTPYDFLYVPDFHAVEFQ